jgi:hypothetical protein
MGLQSANDGLRFQGLLSEAISDNRRGNAAGSWKQSSRKDHVVLPLFRFWHFPLARARPIKYEGRPRVTTPYVFRIGLV